MNYCINLGKWNHVFAVPMFITDNYLKSANEVQIKVLLYILRNSDEKIDIQKIGENVGFPYEKIVSALEYWHHEGIIAKKFANQNVMPEKDYNFHNLGITNVNKKINLRYQRPDSQYIAERIKNSKEMSYLIQESQVIFGRTLSSGDIATLMMLHDNDGLPIDVILMLIQYAVGEGKSGMKYIEKMGINWAEQGIDNLEKAEKKISQLNLVNILWRRFENIIGIDHRAPTNSESEAVVRWFHDWNFSDELIKESYDRCVNTNGKYILKYMDSIIKRWHTQGIFNIEQALIENSMRKKHNAANKKEDNKPSYSIDDYEKYNIFDYIKN